MGKSAARVTQPIPPLRDGDRLTAAEFLRRYEAAPEGVRAELLNGVVFVNRWIEVSPNGRERLMPPISGGGHGVPLSLVSNLLSNYMIFTPHVTAYSPTTVVLSDTDTVPEPDGLLGIDAVAGGRSALGPDDYIHGPPELVVEVSNTSASFDLGPKRELYERNGVAEYIVWRTQRGTVDWFRRNRVGRYVPIVADADGIHHSRVFPGLWLDAAALIAYDKRRFFEVGQLGRDSPEHIAFVEKLRRRAERSRR